VAHKDFVVATTSDGRWYVKREGATRLSGIFPTEHDAEEYGWMLARSWHSDLTVREPDGTVRVTRYDGPPDEDPEEPTRRPRP